MANGPLWDHEEALRARHWDPPSSCRWCGGPMIPAIGTRIKLCIGVPPAVSCDGFEWKVG